MFVDAGYLTLSTKALLVGSDSPRKIRADRPALIAAIRGLAVAETGLPLLRIYWYDAAPNRTPYPDQRELARFEDVKLRLGNLRVRDDGRVAQKGVDADLHADMTSLARNRGASDFVLLSGDEDLLRAVDEVQGYGVRMHLWGVDSAEGSGNQSLELIAAADRWHVLDAQWLRAVYTVLPDRSELAAGVAEVAAASTVPVVDGGGEPAAPTPAEGEPEAPQPEAAPDEEHEPARPTPALIAAVSHRPSAPPVQQLASSLRYTSTGSGSHYVRSDRDNGFLRLSDLSTRDERARDAEEDARREGDDAFSIGRTYGTRWRRRATQEAIERVVRRFPGVPKVIDAELLRYADSRGADTWNAESVKHAVRDGFWAALREGGD